MTDGNLAWQVYALLETPGIGRARVVRLWEWLQQHHLPVATLGDSSFLAERFGSSVAEAFRQRLDRAARTWEALNENGVRVITSWDADYPAWLRSLLGRGAPLLLFVLGNPELFRKLSVGFCGSRKASGKGMDVAAACAAELGLAGVNIVSGYAAGVDLHAHRAALEAGGTTTVVLAEGIQRFRVRRDLKDVWDESRTLVVSEFLPGIPWSVRNAMQRNRTIIGLSRAMVLIEARSSGGSMQAGREALRLGVPLFAAVYEGMPAEAEGNRQLLEEGARRILRNRTTGKPNVEPILAALRGSVREPDPKVAAKQAPLPLGT